MDVSRGGAENEDGKGQRKKSNRKPATCLVDLKPHYASSAKHTAGGSSGPRIERAVETTRTTGRDKGTRSARRRESEGNPKEKNGSSRKPRRRKKGNIRAQDRSRGMD